ncbi:hypothetical protein [Alkalimonas mucilaginosa]|uniref:Uncharacterized protein n=1 Tax=Alkalimonas mucilaginosa TaxID=3057676 RepID=A0ABU7JFV6_9GAMM|nr:hypothetical protein [Alkalimonas sp. MEB004]MEE2024572.1 hypothetical protein [Alkalimonas sp. MEB004]
MRYQVADDNFKESFNLKQFVVFLLVFVGLLLQGPIVRWLQLFS